MALRPDRRNGLGQPGPSSVMAPDAVTAAVIGAVVLFFFFVFLFLRRIVTSFAEGYEERR